MFSNFKLGFALGFFGIMFIIACDAQIDVLGSLQYFGMIGMTAYGAISKDFAERSASGQLILNAEHWLYPEYDSVQVVVKEEHGKFVVYKEMHKIILVEDGYMVYEDVESDIDLYDVYDTKEEAEEEAHWYFLTTVNC